MFPRDFTGLRPDAKRVSVPVMVAPIGLPSQLSGASVERDDIVIPGDEVNSIVVESDAPFALAAPRGRFTSVTRPGGRPAKTRRSTAAPLLR